MVRRAARSRPRASGVHRRDLDSNQHDPQPRPLLTGRAAADGLPARPPQDDHAGRRPAPDRHGRADGARWPDQRRLVRGLCRPGARARPQARRHCHHGQPVQPQARQHPRPDRGGRRPRRPNRASRPGGTRLLAVALVQHRNHWRGGAPVRRHIASRRHRRAKRLQELGGRFDLRRMAEIV